MLGGGLPGGGLPANLYPQMMAFAAAQENATAMVAVAKLAPSKANASTNSALVVRGSVRKFSNPMNGILLSVAEWTRKTVEENLEWLVKISKRHSGGDKVVLLAYGDGCETLVLMDDQINKMPANFSKIKKVGVGATMTNIDSTVDETKLAALGVLQPSDSIWEHLRFETMTPGDKKLEKCLFIHTNVTVWSEGLDGRRRVLQVTTGSGLRYKPNALFEQEVLNNWRGKGPAAAIPRPVAGPKHDEEPAENETLITFNPKELLLLEKAFDNRMTNRDRKTNVSKFTEEDRKAAQLVIQRAQKEFVMRGPSRKRKKKSETPSEEVKKPKVTEEVKRPNVSEEVKKPKVSEQVKKPKAVKAEAKENKASPAKKPKPTESKPAKTTPTKAMKKDDDDDEPISKMVKKAEKTPAKKARRSSTTGSTKDAKPQEPKSEPRGRKSTRGQPKEAPSPRKRSKSRSKS